MDVARLLGGGLAINRAAFGLSYVLRPQSAGPTWLGRAARRPATKVMTRSQGVRDVALGAGALLALGRGDTADARIWLAGHALADATDLVATWLARRRLPKRGSRIALTAAALSTAVAAGAAAGLRGER